MDKEESAVGDTTDSSLINTKPAEAGIYARFTVLARLLIVTRKKV